MEDFKRAYNSSYENSDKPLVRKSVNNKSRTEYGKCDDCGFIVNLIDHTLRCRIPNLNGKFQHDAAWIGDAYLGAHVKTFIMEKFGRNGSILEQMVSNASLSDIYRLFRPQEYHEAFSSTGSSHSSIGRAVEAAYALLPNFRLRLLQHHGICNEFAFDYSLLRATYVFVSNHVSMIPISSNVWGYCYLQFFGPNQNSFMASELGPFPLGHVLMEVLHSCLDDSFKCYVKDFSEYTHLSMSYFPGSTLCLTRRDALTYRQLQLFGGSGRRTASTLSFQTAVAWIGSSYLSSHVKASVLATVGYDREVSRSMTSNEALTEIYHGLQPQCFSSDFIANGNSASDYAHAVESAYVMIPKFRMLLLSNFKVDIDCAFDKSLLEVGSDLILRGYLEKVIPFDGLWGFCYLSIFPSELHLQLADFLGSFPTASEVLKVAFHYSFPVLHFKKVDDYIYLSRVPFSSGHMISKYSHLSDLVFNDQIFC